MTETTTTLALIEQVRAIAPDLDWREDRYALDREKVHAHRLPGRRWINVEAHPRKGFVVSICRHVRDVPRDRDLDSFYAHRHYSGEDLPPLISDARADTLEPITVLGVTLWPHCMFGDEGYVDDARRLEITRYPSGWRWQVRGEPAKTAVSLLNVGASHGLGGESATMAEAVADALDAPRRFAAMLEILTAELSADTPDPDPYTYAAVIEAKDGHRDYVGPLSDLLDLKEVLRHAEGPFIGRMNTDASHIVAVPTAEAGGLDAVAMVAHPSAQRLSRY